MTKEDMKDLALLFSHISEKTLDDKLEAKYNKIKEKILLVNEQINLQDKIEENNKKLDELNK